MLCLLVGLLEAIREGREANAVLGGSHQVVNWSCRGRERLGVGSGVVASGEIQFLSGPGESLLTCLMESLPVPLDGIRERRQALGRRDPAKGRLEGRLDGGIHSGSLSTSEGHDIVLSVVL